MNSVAKKSDGSKIPIFDFPHIRVSVRGGRFLTWVNGQLVSSWTDARLTTGGIGFFAESGESSAIRWVSVTERDSMLGRFLSYFSILTFSARPPQAP